MEPVYLKEVTASAEPFCPVRILNESLFNGLESAGERPNFGGGINFAALRNLRWRSNRGPAIWSRRRISTSDGRAGEAIVLYNQIMKGLWGMATRMVRPSRTLIWALGLGVIATVLIAAGSAVAQGSRPAVDPENPTIAERPFVHPGLLHTEQDIIRMRTKVA